MITPLVAIPLLLAGTGPGPAAVAPAAPVAPSVETVVLLHGLGRSPRSMKALQVALARDGYEVRNLDYPSRRKPIEDLEEVLHEQIGELCADPGVRLHFVTHSMGGLLVRSYLSHRPCPSLGRTVMLSPPNHGSEIVDALEKIPFFGRHLGPSRGQLGTGATGIAARLGPLNFEAGIIAGRSSKLPFFSWLLPGPDDGVVSVRSARIEGMADFVTVERGHTFIMRSPRVIELTRRFLRDGRFAASDGA